MLVHRITDLHGGAVTAESQGYGHGATFTVTLPAMIPPDRGNARQPAMAAEEFEPILQGIRVLVVDDVPEARDLLALQLIRAVRTLGADHGGGIPAIAVTAYAGAEARARALSAGYQRYFVKPLDIPLFAEALEELIAEQRHLTE